MNATPIPFSTVIAMSAKEHSITSKFRILVIEQSGTLIKQADFVVESSVNPIRVRQDFTGMDEAIREIKEELVWSEQRKLINAYRELLEKEAVQNGDK